MRTQHAHPNEYTYEQDTRLDLGEVDMVEMSRDRLAVLNKEAARLQTDGWTVQIGGDQLVATRKSSARSPLEHAVIAALILGGLTYAALAFAGSDTISSLPVSHLVATAIAAAIGFALAWRSSTAGEGRTERITIGVDRYNRPITYDQRRDL